MNLHDWITKYEDEAEEFEMLPGFSIFYRPDKGFFCWRVWRDIFEIDHTCTSDLNWADAKILELAKQHECRILRTATTRNPAAYMRLTKGTPNISLSGIRPNGHFYWVFERKVI
jgi:hypothetical protein